MVPTHPERGRERERDRVAARERQKERASEKDRRESRGAGDPICGIGPRGAANRVRVCVCMCVCVCVCVCVSHLAANDDNENVKIVVDGVSMVKNKLKKTLSKYEVESFDSIGEVFNPDYHEAIMSQISDEKENTIIEEFEKGYKIKDKIIRHSKVIVSKGKK